MCDFNLLLNRLHTLLKLPDYKNEFNTMQYILRHESSKERRKICRDWLYLSKRRCSSNNKVEKMKRESIRLREEGNKKIKLKTKQSSLQASRIYTKAIFAAPPNSEAHALAYANRAMALQDFGYFQQAYDDCVCAREFGYPANLLHKVITRQAVCAFKLENAELLKLHLDELSEVQLNGNYTQQVNELREELNNLTNNQIAKISKGNMVLNKITKAQISKSTKGRCMIAKENIYENEVIFDDYATSFVPVLGNSICQQCAVKYLIPIPCSQCRGEVVYCSIKCRNAHSKIHALECCGYQMHLFNTIGISHLAFRVMADGLPSVINVIEKKNTAVAIWEELINNVNNHTLMYSNILHMVTHISEMTLDDILLFALVSDLLVVYLTEFTTFFQQYENSKIERNDLELIIGSLILRHIGQLIVNARSIISPIASSWSTSEDDDLDFFLLSDDAVWDSPLHLQCGSLHRFCYYGEIASGLYPYLCMSNHACIQTFQPRFSGIYYTAFATRNIAKGEEIFDCYTVDYRKSMRKFRQRELNNTYKFICECDKCKKTNPDEEYEKYHCYRCQVCCKKFIPYLPNFPSLNWWDDVDFSTDTKSINCIHCGKRQDIDMLRRFSDLLNCVENAAVRNELYQLFTKLSNWLLEYHELKMSFAFQLVYNCFAIYNDGCSLEDKEFDQLVTIYKFYLRGIAEQYSLNSFAYVSKMTYLWDFIALRKYICTQNEMSTMLKALDMISDELRTIFLNYYHDYVEPKLEE